LIASSTSAVEKIEKRQLQALLREITGRFGKQLNSREKEILDRRILSDQPLTLRALGEKFGVSRERIRQLEGRIIEKLRACLLKELPNLDRYFHN
jgi:RNA polymerase sigma-32 factor